MFLLYLSTILLNPGRLEGFYSVTEALSLTLTVHQIAETRSIIDCPINDPHAILQILFSGRHISVNWTIMGRSSLCYLMNGLNLMKGRRLGPDVLVLLTRPWPVNPTHDSIRG